MSKTQSLALLKSAITLVLISAGFCCWVLLCVFVFLYLKTDASNFSSPSDYAAVLIATPEATKTTGPRAKQALPAVPVKITDELRYTTMGWQTPSHWVRQPTQVSRIPMDRLHPILLGLGILFTSLMAIVMDAPEDEVERLLKSSTIGRSNAPSHKLDKLRELTHN